LSAEIVLSPGTSVWNGPPGSTIGGASCQPHTVAPVQSPAISEKLLIVAAPTATTLLMVIQAPQGSFLPATTAGHRSARSGETPDPMRAGRAAAPKTVLRQRLLQWHRRIHAARFFRRKQATAVFDDVRFEIE